MSSCGVIFTGYLLFQFEAELLNCLQQTCGISLSMEEMMSSWEKLVDPLINVAQKRKILTSVDEGNLKFVTFNFFCIKTRSYRKIIFPMVSCWFFPSQENIQ